MQAFVIHMVLAVIWLFLAKTPSLIDFVVGVVIGFTLLALFHGAVSGLNYVRRSLALVRFLFIFAWELLSANLSLVRIVLTRRQESLHPNFVEYDVSDLTTPEILLLAYCITLTPGSTPVEILPDEGILLLHVLQADDPERERRAIRDRLERNIRAFTR